MSIHNGGLDVYDHDKHVKIDDSGVFVAEERERYHNLVVPGNNQSISLE